MLKLGLPRYRNRVWAKIANKDELLCRECFEKRAAERGVRISFADMMPSAINVITGDDAWLKEFG